MATSKQTPIVHHAVQSFEHGRSSAVEGVEVPYVQTIYIDGEEALRLCASDFKYVGQMNRFVEWMNLHRSDEPAPKPPARELHTGYRQPKSGPSKVS